MPSESTFRRTLQRLDADVFEDLAGQWAHQRTAPEQGTRRAIRGHWAIEDRLHWVRDMDFDEDRSKVRTNSGPRVMAALRNLAITILRLAGHASIATALRYHARRPDPPYGRS